MSKHWRALLPLASVLVTHGVTPAGTAAQGTARERPQGVREGSGRVVISNGLRILTASTTDGLVELVLTSDSANALLTPREPREIRAFYEPAAILRWVNAVDSLQAAVAANVPLSQMLRQSAQLTGGDALLINALASDRSGKRYLSLSLADCRRGYLRSGSVDATRFRALVANLEAAAIEARTVAPDAVVDIMNARVYYEHAVGCTAEPYVSNPPPEYPVVPPVERRRREVLAEFIVDSTGLVDIPSVQFPDGADARFASAARAVLLRWRFTKPTRAGIAVRQLTHRPIVFDPPVGDRVAPGCAMGALMGVTVRAVTGTDIEPAYLMHVATSFLNWMQRPGMVGALARFVVRRDGRYLDPSLDRVPADSAARFQFDSMIRNTPFTLDPLPPTYGSDAVALEVAFVPACESPRAAVVLGAPTAFTPLPDGLIEVANLHLNWRFLAWTREAPPSRDVLEPRALAHFIDTTQTLLPGPDGMFPKPLDRWSGSLAEVPILGYRNNAGLILGIGTQGQLHGGISCGKGDESINFRREDLPAFWRMGREALAARSQVAVVSGSRSRVYAESEVACAALLVNRELGIDYPPGVTGDARSSHEVLVSLTVDTLGTVEPRSITTSARSDARFRAAVREGVVTWRFRPALRGGRRVRQRLHLSVILRPPEADGAALAAQPSVPLDTAKTIFFKKP